MELTHQVNLICISSLVTHDADQRLEQIQHLSSVLCSH